MHTQDYFFQPIVRNELRLILDEFASYRSTNQIILAELRQFCSEALSNSIGNVIALFEYAFEYTFAVHRRELITDSGCYGNLTCELKTSEESPEVGDKWQNCCAVPDGQFSGNP